MLLPLLLLGGYAAVTLSLTRRAPSTLRDGCFTIDAWYLPAAWHEPRIVPLADGPGIGMRLVPWNTMQPAAAMSCILELGADGGLMMRPFSGDWPQSRSMLLLDRQGGGLQALRKSSSMQASSANGRNRIALRYAERLGAEGGPWKSYSLSVPSGSGRSICCTLQDGALAVLPQKPDSYGRAWLQVVRPDGEGIIVQEFDNVVQCGPAWTDGAPGIALLQRPGKVWTLDRRARRLTEQPALRRPAVECLADQSGLTALALSGSMLVVRQGSALACFAANGERTRIQEIDPQWQLPDGTQRFMPNLTSMLPGPHSRRFAAWQASVRREGRSAPANKAAALGRPVPIGPGAVVMPDADFGRLLIIRCEGEL